MAKRFAVPIFKWNWIHNTGSLNIHGTYVTANNLSHNDGVFFFASILKIVCYNNN